MGGDRCLYCNVPRSGPTGGEKALRRAAVAAGPCPGKKWTTLTEGQMRQRIAEYLSVIR
jgi:hypothetical protein